MARRRTLADRAITLGVSGGIAAYKSAEIVRLLKGMGIDVRVIMTRTALELMSPHALATLSEHPVASGLFEPSHLGDRPGIGHIDLGRDTDLLVVAPATANVIGKAAGGIADDLLTTTIMASAVPVLFAPAMNTRMWENPILQDNIAKLRDRGYGFIEPTSGSLACGEVGPGRLADPEGIVHEVVLRLLERESSLRVLVTAGPTEEAVDPVRVLSNRSSGKMGVAIAEAARNRGHQVILVAGPLGCPAPLGVRRIDVRTALEMEAAVRDQEASADIVVMAAAVADYRARDIGRSKLPSGRDGQTIDLIPNPDILKAIAPARAARGAVTVGFALEVGAGGEERARVKLESKGLDMIALNDATRPDSAFGSDTTRITLFHRDGRTEALAPCSKAEAGMTIIHRAEALCGQGEKP